MTPGTYAVSCRGLVKRYGDVVAVNGLDLDELRARELALTLLTMHSATLEDVFVTMTGRHLRE